VSIAVVSEGIAAKARRLLADGNVQVLECGYGRPARVRVEGDHADYLVVVSDRGAVCSCPSFRKLCSHAVAAGLVVAGSTS
jgi:hypothetical protein